MRSIYNQPNRKNESLQNGSPDFLKRLWAWLESFPGPKDLPKWAKKDKTAYLLLILSIIGVAAGVAVSALLSIWIPGFIAVAVVAGVVGLYIFIPILAMLSSCGLPSFVNIFAINVVDSEFILPAHATYVSLPPSTPYTPPRSSATV